MLVTSTFRITGFDFTYGRPAFSAAPPTVQLMFVSSTYRITGLHYTYGSATLSAAYAGYRYFLNHWVKPQILVSNRKCSLFWLLPVSESLADTTLLGV